mgnify:CR=1 FL=1
MQNALALTNQRSERVEKFERAFFTALPFLMFACIVFMNSIMPALAAGSGSTGYMSEVGAMATQIVTIVGYIFRIIGVIMAVYAIATLIQAFQSNNPDAQARGAQVAIVAIILIFIPTIIDNFKLTDYLTK